jgi:hypothetical protein
MFLGAVHFSASEITLARLELLLVDFAPRIPLTQDFQRFVAPCPASHRKPRMSPAITSP